MTQPQVESDFSRNAVWKYIKYIELEQAGKVNAEHSNGITLWLLLLAETKGLLSLAGESRMSSMLSSADSGLQQQVDLPKKKAQFIASRSFLTVYNTEGMLTMEINPHLVSSPHVNLSTL